ncbi:MAG: helix-turn-helix transcriptional regulator [Candidatus Thiodiazotropha sp. (ex Dulcina madagascariensis)]|nr:helix-turn-helix transcriptional regulator [Candidatus Thiodiazotropha sp. (ex Dulcina madagascariensis)]
MKFWCLSAASMTPPYHLTDTETATCRLMVEGCTNRDIADIRDVSPETVKTQIGSILRKTGALNRVRTCSSGAFYQSSCR